MMKKPDRFWDWAAARYDRRAREDEDLTDAVARLAPYLQTDHRVLDYACGTGVVTCKIAADVREVDAIDTSAKMIDLAKQNASDRGVTNVRFAQKAVFDHSLEPESYDVILAFNILHLLDDARTAVRRVSELLRPGGLMVSVTPCLGDAGAVLRTVLLGVSKLGLLSYLRPFRASEVNELISRGGLRILETDVAVSAISTCFIVARKG